MLIIDAKSCLSCVGCIALCPEKALCMGLDTLCVNHDLCTSCRICVRFCPVKAISLDDVLVPEQEEVA